MSDIAAIGLCVAVIVFCGVMLWRNNIVHAVRIARINAISEEAHRRIHAGDFVSTHALWAEYDNGPSYDAMLFDLRTWRATSFYPLPVGASLSQEVPA